MTPEPYRQQQGFAFFANASGCTSQLPQARYGVGDGAALQDSDANCLCVCPWPGSRLVLGRAKGRVHCVPSPLDVTAKQRLLLTHAARPHWGVEAAGLPPTREASPASRPSPGGCGEGGSTAGDSRQNSAQTRGPGYGHVPRLGAGPPGPRPMGPSDVPGAEPRRRREPTRE